MAEPMVLLFTCPILVGRHLDLAALHMLIDRKSSGAGQALLISGEAGIGKSRLVAEAKVYAEQRNFLLLEGQCFQTDRTFPYAPLLDLFRLHFVRYSSQTILENVKPLLSELSRRLPDLALLFPHLAIQPAIQSTDPEQEKRQLFAAMTHFFTELASCRPVFLIIEDVHWCDDLSLEFLLHLTRRSEHIPLLLLVTYRNDEVHPALNQCLTQMNRGRLAREFLLTRLSHRDVADMLHAMLDPVYAVDVDIIDTLYTLSEGNPFFVEELLKSLMMAGDLVLADGNWKSSARSASVPRSIQEAVQQRMATLSTDAQRFLTLAAIAGRRFNVSLLQQVIGCDEARLLVLLKEVMVAQLVIEEAVDQFAFRHALTQQAIIASLLLRERQALHRTLAEALEKFSTALSMQGKYLGELAAHYYEAGMWEQAMVYEQQLGERALTLYAQRAAIAHFTRAMNAAQYSCVTPSAQVYLARGQAYETLGEFDHARGDYERALEIARITRNETQEWQSIMALGFLWAGRDYKQAGDRFRQALDQATRIADDVLRARSLNRLGNWLVNTGQTKEGLRAHQHALEIFEARADTRGMAETRDLLGTAYGMDGDRFNAVECLGQAIVLLRTLGDERSLTSSLAMRAIQSSALDSKTTFHVVRTYDECVREAEEAVRLARQIGSLSGQAFAEFALSVVYATFNELGKAFTHALEARRIATIVEHRQCMTIAAYGLGNIYLLLLQPAQARSALETGLSLARELRSTFLIESLTAFQSLTYVQEHNLSQATSVLASVMSAEQIPRTLSERLMALTWGELALARGEPRPALERAQLLLASVPGPQQTQSIPYLLKLKGEALTALMRFEEAAEVFEEAKQGASVRQEQSVLWRIHRALGQVYRRLKREEQAQREYSAAKQIIEALAATIHEKELQEHFLHTALTSLPQAKPRSPQQVAKQMFDGLTTREREVVVLIARGCTNGEIATHFVVSERTVEAHVSNILGKLGYTSRAQIAAWAVEKGLAIS